VLPKRVHTQDTSENANIQSNPMELVLRLISELEPLLGFSDIDQAKVYTILLKSDFVIAKSLTKIKRNVAYYKKILKIG